MYGKREGLNKKRSRAYFDGKTTSGLSFITLEFSQQLRSQDRLEGSAQRDMNIYIYIDVHTIYT